MIPFYVAGRQLGGQVDEVLQGAARPVAPGVLTVRHPLDTSLVGETSNATPAQVEEAVAAATAAAGAAADLSAAARAAALDEISTRIKRRAEGLAELITADYGKPLKWARAEVGRAVSTFRWAAEEGRRFSGELQRLHVGG